MSGDTLAKTSWGPFKALKSFQKFAESIWCLVPTTLKNKIKKIEGSHWLTNKFFLIFGHKRL